MSLNLVQLIGLVAARPVRCDGEESWSLLIVTATPGGERRQRHRVVADGNLAATVTGLRVGQCVFVSGSLRRDERHRVTTLARELWAVGEALVEAAVPMAPHGHHASPREHQRSAHWRHVNRGTARERLCWVRATVVGRDLRAFPEPERRGR